MTFDFEFPALVGVLRKIKQAENEPEPPMFRFFAPDEVMSLSEWRRIAESFDSIECDGRLDS